MRDRNKYCDILLKVKGDYKLLLSVYMACGVLYYVVQIFTWLNLLTYVHMYLVP